MTSYLVVLLVCYTTVFLLPLKQRPFSPPLFCLGLSARFTTKDVYKFQMDKTESSAMHQMLRLIFAAMAVVFVSASVEAQVAVTQIKLTEKHVEGFIAAKKDMSAVVEQVMQGTVFSDSDNAKYKSELKSIIKKHGFKNFAEYEAVTASFYSVMESIDPQTKVFTDLRTAIKRELVGVNSELNVPNSEKKRLRESLALAQRAARPIQFPTNIQLVQRYYDKIGTTVASNDGDSWQNARVVPKVGE